MPLPLVLVLLLHTIMAVGRPAMAYPALLYLPAALNAPHAWGLMNW